MSIRPMPEDYKNVFFFTKMLLRIVINQIEYQKFTVSLLSQKFLIHLIVLKLRN